ncbi:bZIP transcription factor TRAB1 [Iris pallida]|uniref:BZIP transcription factor TRAB1 n=1 Tax=Iris pallida TaxID=29817 RepID=A0AAX6DJN3_IRIPA|nr:bZIP transcription factor TRAB1 [Iris pallida]
MNFNNMGSGGKEARPPATPLPLARQLSVYSLTFDEFQSTLGGPGKDFGSMNMDEFLRNIWTAEESQAMASALGGGGGGGASGSRADLGFVQGQSSNAGLQRQGSLTLPRTLSQKTVDEVWRDLLRESELPQHQQQQQQQQQHRQPTLGEMTLEEFLVRAGVVREEMNQPTQAVQRRVVTNNNNGNGNNTNMFFAELSGGANSNQGLGLGYPQAARTAAGGNSAANLAAAATATMTRPFPVLGGNVNLGNQQGMRGGGMVGMGDQGMGNGLLSNGLVPGMVGLGGGGGGVTVATVGSPDGLGKGNGDLSSLSPVPFTFGAGIRGRKSTGAVEKVVERRQRRMIKNRESAARSRARKQAYTMELEAEVAKLKEQNQELQKKQEEIMEMQKNQVMEMINQQPGPKKRCLRRTQTGPW